MYIVGPDSNDVLVELTPLYDLVCTMHYPNLSPQMAMAIVKYKSDRVQPSHFDILAEECGLSKSLVKKRLVDMARMINEQIDQVITGHPVSIAVGDRIKKHAQQILLQFQK